MQSFRQLDVWKKSHQLTLDVYRQTATFPRDEIYGLTSQLRRSCVSVPSNIAEGCGRSTPSDFSRFLDIAAGSVSEADYQLLLARDLNYLDSAVHAALEARFEEVRRMLSGLLRRVRSQD